MKINWLTKRSYRNKVTGIVVDGKGEFLLDSLVNYDKNDWNFPGGGIETGESEEQAILRKLEEELGTDKFTIIKKSKNLTYYDWPIKVIIRRFLKDRRIWKGQRQRFFLIKFLGANNNIRPNPNEIKRIKWVKRNEFKRYLKFPNQLKIAEGELAFLQKNKLERSHSVGKAYGFSICRIFQLLFTSNSFF